MKVLVESTETIDYLEIILTPEEIESLPKRGVVKDFVSPVSKKNKRKVLNIFVRPENTEEVPESTDDETYNGEYPDYAFEAWLERLDDLI